MKTTKTILLAAILVFATQFSFGQQFLNTKADLNNPNKHKIELRKKGHERPTQRIAAKPKLEKCNKKIAQKQIQQKRQKVVQKKQVVQPIVKKRR